jgi:DHA1 family tetracycline resistance protein-like MFS transporter
MASPPDSTRSAKLVVFVAVFIDLIGFGIVLPLLPSYAARMQVSDAGIGILVASFSLMQFLLAPWWGRLSDRMGRRPVILIGLAGSTVSYLLFAFAGNFLMLLLSRVVAGGMGATVSVAQAYLADITPPEERARAMGLIGAAFGLGFVIGPAIGGISSRWGDAGPGLIAAGLTTANFLLAWYRLPETRVHQPTTRAAVPVHWRLLLAPYSVTFLSTIAFTVMYVVFPLLVERTLGYDRHHTAYFFVLIGLVTAIVQGGLVGRLARIMGERQLMEIGSLLLGLGLAAIPYAVLRAAGGSSPLPVLIPALLLLAFGPGLIGPSASGYVSRIAPTEEQGRALGTLVSVGAVARIVGPITAGMVNQYGGTRTAFLVSAAAAGAGVVLGAMGRKIGAG